MNRGAVLYFPPEVVADLDSRRNPETLIAEALQSFLFLSELQRLDLVSSYWWGAQRKGSWRKVHISGETLALAKLCKTRTWGRDQTVVAALVWYLSVRPDHVIDTKEP